GGSLSAGSDGTHVVAVGVVAGFLDVNAQTWTQANDPGGRSDPVVAFAGDGQALLFGGSAGGCTDGLCNDSWIFDGASTSWAQEQPATPPPSREKASLAFDNDRSEVVLFGGNGVGGALDDTWAFRGGEWR